MTSSCKATQLNSYESHINVSECEKPHQRVQRLEVTWRLIHFFLCFPRAKLILLGRWVLGGGVAASVGREQALCFLLGMECAGWFDSLES